eukprot:353698-Chlamydomonas_euryale.AAC.8
MCHPTCKSSAACRNLTKLRNSQKHHSVWPAAKGLPAKGLLAKGLPAKALPAKGLPAMGLHAEALPAKGLPAAGWFARGLPARGLPAGRPLAGGLHAGICLLEACLPDAAMRFEPTSIFLGCALGKLRRCLLRGTPGAKVTP